MIVLVTGAAGQDGRLLIANLKNKGYKVIAVTRTEITCIEGSRETTLGANHGLEDKDFCHSILSEFRPEFIFHFAAVHGSSKSGINNSPNLLSAMRACHITTTLHFLQWMKNKSVVSKMIFPLSSQLFRPLAFPTIIDEFSYPHANNFYADTKLEAWNLIQEYRDKFELWVSCPILFGHTSSLAKSSFLFPELAKQLHAYLNGHTNIIKVTDAFTPISMCSAREVVSAIIKLTLLKDPHDLVLGDDKGCSISTLLDVFLSNWAPPISAHYELRSLVNTPKPFLLPNISKASLLLDWKPKLKQDEILLDIFQKQKI